jgi:pilus assembly protein CpaE
MAEKILIIDDDLETLRLIGLMLQRQGFKIVAANNGTQGINLAKKERPDLIVLDVMMPDMDGFAVTNSIRNDPDLADTPILMFTAKSQVDDKVAGFEAGVDDYLTKPVHPVELVAHIKALLSRFKTRTGPLKPPHKGYLLGVMSPKGGLGVSMIVLNLGISLFNKTEADILCAELRPGQGTWGIELGISDDQNLNNIISKETVKIDDSLIRENLFNSSFGPKLLLSTSNTSNIEINTHSDQIEKLIQIIPDNSQFGILDFGNGLNGTIIDNFVKYCDEIIVVTESQPIAVQKTRLLIDELEKQGFGKNKVLSILICNRLRADIQLTVSQIQEKLGHVPLLIIPPAPELSYQAAIHFQPIIRIQPESLITQQFSKLAENYIKRLQK